MKTDDAPEVLHNNLSREKLPKVKTVSPRLILQAITLSADVSKERV